MSERSKAFTGGCICGAVRVEGHLAGTTVQACHCTQCQRWTGGGPLLSVRVSDLKITGEDAISSYRASDWGERAFCGTCGSTLYWRMQGRPIAYIAVGLLDDQSGLTVTEEIFTDTRPGWLPEWHGASQSTQAEELAKLHAFLEGEKP
ncbi:MAG: GFA family protein [Rubricella sp.]